MKRTLLLGLALLASALSGLAATVTLAWDPNPEPDIAGYRIYWRTNTQSYSTNWMLGVSNTTSASVSNLVLGRQYFFVATAYNTSGLESDYSNEVTAVIPGRPIPPRNLRTNQVIVKASLLMSPAVNGMWANVYNYDDVVMTNSLDTAFYRTQLALRVVPLYDMTEDTEPLVAPLGPGECPPLPSVVR